VKNNIIIKIVFFQIVVKKMVKKSFFLKKGIDKVRGIVYKQFHRRELRSKTGMAKVGKVIREK
jgi:hypothetical protein